MDLILSFSPKGFHFHKCTTIDPWTSSRYIFPGYS